MRRLTRWSRRWARKKVAIFLRENGLRGFGSLVGGVKVPDYVADNVAKGTLVIVVTQVKLSLGGQIIG